VRTLARCIACVFELAEFVEDSFLSQEYPQPDRGELAPPLPRARNPREALVAAWSHFLTRICFTPDWTLSNPQLVSDPLPSSSFHIVSRVNEIKTELTTALGTIQEPQVYRSMVQKQANDSEYSTRYTVGRLLCPSSLYASRTVDVRISPGSVFTFCKSQHALIRSGRLTPPSVIRRMTLKSFARRCLAGHEEPPLVYHEPAAERFYLQTEVIPHERILTPRLLQDMQVAQVERAWVSTAGTVTSLHYDSAWSAIAQIKGRKRVTLFEPSVLPQLRPYPVDHPLGRRCRGPRGKSPMPPSNSTVLLPGDVLVFPPQWAHYIESLDYSVSHTLRWVPSSNAKPNKMDGHKEPIQNSKAKAFCVET